MNKQPKETAPIIELLEDEELSLLQSLLVRPNIKVKDKTELREFIGRHVYLLKDDDRQTNKQYFKGEIYVIRETGSWYGPGYSDGQLKVGPIGSLNPANFTISIAVEDVFLIPRTKEELVLEYNRLISATEQLAARIDYMEATDKAQFDEKLYSVDKTFTDLYALWGQPEVGTENNITEKENKIKVFLRKAIKI